jgi:hypothetical protein
MAGEDGWTRVTGSNGNTVGEAPLLQQARSAEPVPRAERLRFASAKKRQPSGSKGMLDRTLQARIGRMLRHIFSDVADEPVPSRFVELLEALAKAEREKSQQ